MTKLYTAKLSHVTTSLNKLIVRRFDYDGYRCWTSSVKSDFSANVISTVHITFSSFQGTLTYNRRIVVGGLRFFRDSSSTFFYFFHLLFSTATLRARRTELIRTDHMLGSECGGP